MAAVKEHVQLRIYDQQCPIIKMVTDTDGETCRGNGNKYYFLQNERMPWDE